MATKNDPTEENIVYMDDNFRDIILIDEDVDSEDKHLTPRDEESYKNKVKPFYFLEHFGSKSIRTVMLFQALDQDGEKFLQLSVKDLRKIVNARKKVDHRKEKKMD